MFTPATTAHCYTSAAEFRINTCYCLAIITQGAITQEAPGALFYNKTVNRRDLQSEAIKINPPEKCAGLCKRPAKQRVKKKKEKGRKETASLS